MNISSSHKRNVYLNFSAMYELVKHCLIERKFRNLEKSNLISLNLLATVDAVNSRFTATTSTVQEWSTQKHSETNEQI